MAADPEFNERENTGEIREDTTQRLHHFLAMLEEEDPSRRWKAAESLGRMGDDHATGPLITLLVDEDWRVRQKAAWALGEIGDPRALVPLRRAMMHETEGVREIISEALEKIKRKIRQ